MSIDGNGKLVGGRILRTVGLRLVAIIDVILISVIVLITVPQGAVRASAA